MKGPNLDKLFNPKNIALIGASGSPGKWGFIILLNILGDYQVKRAAVYFAEVEDLGEFSYVYNGNPLPRMRLRIVLGRRFLGNWRPSTARPDPP